jgi:hypothetical protein
LQCFSADGFYFLTVEQAVEDPTQNDNCIAYDSEMKKHRRKMEKLVILSKIKNYTRVVLLSP